MNRLTQLGFGISKNPQYPGVDCSALLVAERWEEFMETLEWIMAGAFAHNDHNRQ